MATESNGSWGGRSGFRGKSTNGSEPRQEVDAENVERLDSVSRTLPISELKAPSRADARPALEPRLPHDNVDTTQGDIVARAGVTLNGTITSCGTLTVEGKVKAKLRARQMVIPKNGSFTGDAEVDQAEIAGRFEGVLRVSGRLILRRTGRFQGRASYGQLEIEPGGELLGRVEVFFAGEKSSLFGRTLIDRFFDR